jgi:hypothetical protein
MRYKKNFHNQNLILKKFSGQPFSHIAQVATHTGETSLNL